VLEVSHVLHVMKRRVVEFDVVTGRGGDGVSEK
jgi:hypothetical protein